MNFTNVTILILPAEKGGCLTLPYTDSPRVSYNLIHGPLQDISLTPIPPTLYILPKIHKSNNPSYPIVSSYSPPLSMFSHTLILVPNPLFNPNHPPIKAINHFLNINTYWQVPVISSSHLLFFHIISPVLHPQHQLPSLPAG